MIVKVHLELFPEKTEGIIIVIPNNVVFINEIDTVSNVDFNAKFLPYWESKRNCHPLFIALINKLISMEDFSIVDLDVNEIRILPVYNATMHITKYNFNTMDYYCKFCIYSYTSSNISSIALKQQLKHLSGDTSPDPSGTDQGN